MTADQQVMSSSRVDAGAMYDEHRRILIGTAMMRYGIGEADAESLFHDVFLAYLVGGNDVRDARAWLVASMCNASKAFLRTRGRVVGEPAAEWADPATVGDRIDDELAARQCFTCLTPRCQLALRMRYIEGYSVPEIAAELGTTPKYAQKLVSRCLQQAQDRFGKGVV